MFSSLTRREFIKTAALGFLAANTLGFLEKVFAAENCTVKTKYGTFNGFVDENGVKTWLGIPFAQPPVKKLRWQAPQPLKPSNKTFDAKKYGFAALQLDEDVEFPDGIPQSEDCLTLNIWKGSEKKNLPVMVFIHGGSFRAGGGSDALYNGTNISAANDVIVVTINYRLNIFGFMNFASIDSSFEDSGYLGMKDQVAALTWIKENIAEFGGNPDNITIFGESAGAVSVMFLTVIPAAKNLVQKAIPQSGNSYMYNTPEKSAQIAEMYMEMNGIKTMRELLKKSSAEVINIYAKVKRARRNEAEMDYLPTCDGKYLPKNPFKALKDGSARGIKFLTGTTADEWFYWLSFMDDNFFKFFRDDPYKFSPILPKYKAQSAEKIYKMWLKNRPDTEDNFAEFVNQADWRVGQELVAEYQSNFDDVYYYLFSERSTNEKLRSCHSIELTFIFNNPDDIYQNPPKHFVKQIQASWAAFAANGNPDSEFIPHWEKYSAKNRQTMELNSKNCVCHKDLNTDNLNSLRYVYES